MNLDLTEAEMPRTGVRLTKVSLIGGVRVSAFGLIGGVAVRTAAGSSRARARPPG